MAQEKHAFLGRGWRFPIEVNAHTGRVEMSEYEQDIQEAVYLILMTRKGERVMRPNFGCDIYDHLFDVVDYTVLKQMEAKVEEALIYWEPRIKEIEVSAEQSENADNCVDIQISYVVRRTNNPFNLVYPFYVYEGMK
jgi:phage baseplate assembly protein W